MFASRRPSAVAWFVISVAVDAVESLTVRPVAHARVEVFEVEPLFTDSDAPAAVEWIAAMARIEATLLHAAPRTISRSVVPAVLGHALSLKATAAHCLATT